MAEVSKIPPPSGAPQGPDKKALTSEVEKFKKEMELQKTKVGQPDADQQKKRKESEDEEEEAKKVKAAQEAITTEEKKKPTPLDLQSGTRGTPSNLPGKTAPQGAPSPQAAFFEKPEEAQDSEAAQETTFDAQAPAPGTGARAPSPPAASQPPAAPSTPQAPGYPTQQSQPSQRAWTPEGQKPVAPGPPESAQKPGEQKPGQAATEPEKKIKAGMIPAKLDPKLPLEEKKEEAAVPVKSEEKKEELKAESAQIQGVGAPTEPKTAAQQLESEKRKAEEEEKKSAVGATILPAGQTDIQTTPGPPPPQSLSPYANLHPQVQEMFDRMVGVMTVMSMSGVTETTITLNSPQFASSVFFGTQIIIQEFSTAPQAFNVQLNGSPQAVALFQGSTNDLMAAFQAGNYNFRINRLETGYLGERPLFKRKEKASGDQKGDHPQ